MDKFTKDDFLIFLREEFEVSDSDLRKMFKGQKEVIKRVKRDIKNKIARLKSLDKSLTDVLKVGIDDYIKKL